MAQAQVGDRFEIRFGSTAADATLSIGEDPRIWDI
jgi:hypothetical protein